MRTGPEGETSIEKVNTPQIGNLGGFLFVSDSQTRFLESIKHPISINKPTEKILEGHQAWNSLYGPKDPKNP